MECLINFDAKIRKDFMPWSMVLVFIKSSMTHKALQCMKIIDAHGALKGVNPTSVCREMKKWIKEAEDIDMGWDRIDGFTYGFRVKQVNSYASFMVELYEKRSGTIVNEVSFKLGIDSRVHYDRGGKVCEILFELLEENGLMSCVSIRKWDGK